MLLRSGGFYDHTRPTCFKTTGLGTYYIDPDGRLCRVRSIQFAINRTFLLISTLFLASHSTLFPVASIMSGPRDSLRRASALLLRQASGLSSSSSISGTGERMCLFDIRSSHSQSISPLAAALRGPSASMLSNGKFDLIPRPLDKNMN